MSMQRRNLLTLRVAGDPLAGHINTTAGLGVSGHSMGGMTTDGLLTAWPDARITPAIPMSTVGLGTPSKSVHAEVLFMHGDKQHVRGLDAVGAVRRHDGPRPPAERRAVLNHHVAVRAERMYR